jgi:hypothetical protein
MNQRASHLLEDAAQVRPQATGVEYAGNPTHPRISNRRTRQSARFVGYG